MRTSDQTLLEQLHFTDREIEHRKGLLNFTAEDAERLKQASQHIHEQVDKLVASFYERQTAFEEIDLLIGDADTLYRLSRAMRSYILDLFSGYYGVDYVNNRLRIGLVHKRIGVEPKLYLSAVWALQELLKTSIQKGGFSNATEIISSLEKLFSFDIQLVFDTYIRSLMSELEIANIRIEKHAIQLQEEVTTRTRQLEELSRRDSLTTLYNQRAFSELLHRDLLTAKRHRTPLSLMFIDVDDFKHYNDSEGHQRGDTILQNVANALSSVIREVDVACRYGGDEFCVVLPNTTVTEGREVALRAIEQLKSTGCIVTLSIGIAQSGPENPLDADSLISDADRQMYRAKQRKGHQVCFESPASGGELTVIHSGDTVP